MLPMVVARLKWLSRKHPDYGKNIRQRFGHMEPRADRPLWIHAVSVGETIAAEPLVRALLEQYPDCPILITNTTPTGAEQTKRLFGDSVSQSYAPYDTPSAINRFVKNLNPRALVVMETELWPNWIAALSSKDIPVMIANARLSERSAKGYARLGAITQEMMSSISLVATQYNADAERFRELGVRSNAVKVLGNIKADISVTDADRKVAEAAKSKVLEERAPILIAASTHPGEDEIILDALGKIRHAYPHTLLYLVPRHPHRAADIAQLMSDRKLNHAKRSNLGYQVNESVDVVLCDQLGELRGLYGASDIVVMGGTLVEHGGHNPLEPAAWGLPIIAGPSQRNFDSLFREMEAERALVRVEANAGAIADRVIQGWNRENRLQSFGTAALTYLESQRGAVDRVLDELNRLINEPI